MIVMIGYEKNWKADKIYTRKDFQFKESKCVWIKLVLGNFSHWQAESLDYRQKKHKLEKSYCFIYTRNIELEVFWWCSDERN